ncbi:MAG TPA: ABC transporter permease [Anaerolineae bacterium]|nr:ABC transporter permease [Anaerolineae bacterium]HQI86662.1 ABC transporter permease [Anaerolineae bacterium]HQK13448.1 ABC transporter permease [Anaerolineae bacterium]
MMSRRWAASLHRTIAVMRREMIERLRDRRTLALILGIPLIQLLLFGYAVKLTAYNLPTVVADMSLDTRSRSFVNALRTSGYFDIQRYVATEADVLRVLDSGTARAGVVIPPNFAANIERGQTQVLIILDGSDSFSVQSGYSAAVAVAQSFALKLVAQQINRLGGQLQTQPIVASTRVLYNPNRDDLVFVMPGLIAMLLQVLAVSMTAQSIVREYELGTIEQIMVTPVRPLELIVGKLTPNILFVVIDQAMITLLGVFWFGVPFRGNPWLLAGLSFLFVCSGLGLGLLISTVAHTQKEAEQLSALLMLFSQLLTGFIYPRSPMPPVVRAVGNLIPLTYYLRIARGIITKGVGLTFLRSDVLALLIYVVVAMGLAAITFKKRLD